MKKVYTRALCLLILSLLFSLPAPALAADAGAGTGTGTDPALPALPSIVTIQELLSDGTKKTIQGSAVTLDLQPAGSGSVPPAGSRYSIDLCTDILDEDITNGKFKFSWTAYRKDAAGIPTTQGSQTVIVSQGYDSTVTITAAAAGTCVVEVKVTDKDGLEFRTAQCAITVNPLALSTMTVTHVDAQGSQIDNHTWTSNDGTPGKDTPTLKINLGAAAAILTPTYDPTNATVDKVEWRSSDPKVATVSGGITSGSVSAVGGGKAIVTATANGKTVQIPVEVPYQKIKSYQIQAVGSAANADLTVGASKLLMSSVTYDNNTSFYPNNAVWSSSDPTVAGVSVVTSDRDQRVTLKAAGAGSCTITAKLPCQQAEIADYAGSLTPGGQTEINAGLTVGLDAGGYYVLAKYEVTVGDNPVTALFLDPNYAQIDVGQEQRFLASFGRNSTGSGTVEWSVGDPSVISAPVHPTGADGRENDKTAAITGLKPGETTISAKVRSAAGDRTDEDGSRYVSASATVVVSGILLDQNAITLAVGDSTQVSISKTFGAAKGLPETDQEWSLADQADERFLTVSSTSGQITAKAVGRATVICTLGAYTAELQVTVTDTSAAQVKHTMRSGETLSFKDILSKFGAPEYITGLSVSGGEGTLYYGYVSANDPGSGVSAADRFYRRSRSAEPSRKLLEQVTFVPAPGFVGTVTLQYTLVPSTGQAKSGSLAITVLDPVKISYVSQNGEAVYFRADDFANYAKGRYGYSISSVRFTIPDARYGWLYAGYSGGEIYSGNITSDRRFYASSTPSIDAVAFVPKQGYTGTFTVKYDGVDTSGRSFTGDVEITVRSAGERGGDIAYTAYVEDRLYFTPIDFQELCTAAGKGTLNYVQFTALPDTAKQGSLYHGDATTPVSKTGRYYYTSEGHTGNFLGSVNFLPNATGKVTIPFTAYASGGNVTGTVAITVLDGTGRAKTVYYTTTGMPVGFTRGDFAAACKAALPGDLSSVTFELPDASCGKLYESFQDLRVNTPLAAGKEVAAAGLIRATFVPKGGTEGSTYINYTAKDTKGNTCSGAVRVYLEPNTVSRYFKDTANYGWAASSLDFLRRYGVVTGYGETTYRPTSPISRGDFTLMLYRALNFPDDGTASFSDVPSDSYYATAIAAAKGKDIAQGSNGRFRPKASISRQDAAVLLYRALQTQGNVPAAQSYDLSRFSDGGRAAGYAQQAMSAMVELGIFRGDNGRLNPTGTLTRAEMAVILHRAIT